MKILLMIFKITVIKGLIFQVIKFYNTWEEIKKDGTVASSERLILAEEVFKLIGELKGVLKV